MYNEVRPALTTSGLLPTLVLRGLLDVTFISYPLPTTSPAEQGPHVQRMHMQKNIVYGLTRSHFDLSSVK